MASRGYRVARDDVRSYDGLSEYLNAKVITGVAGPRLCQAMYHRAKERVDVSEHASGRWWRTSWMTLVLGSGCHDLNERLSSSSSRYPNAIEGFLVSLDDPDDREEVEPYIYRTVRWVSSLIQNRLGGVSEGPSEKGEQIDLDEVEFQVAVRLAVLVAILTELYYRVQANGPTALNRRDRDCAEIDEASETWIEIDPQTGEPIDEFSRVIRPLLQAASIQIMRLREVIDSGSAEPLGGPLENLLLRVREGIREVNKYTRGSLEVNHIRMLTEITWYFIAGSVDAYPGWSDLLLGLMLTGMAGDHSDRLRPLVIDQRSLGKGVAGILEHPTERSWFEKKEASAAANAFTAASEVLRAQAKAGARAATDPATIGEVPPAVAFITSFDIELELTLAAKSAEPFSIAIPVHVSQGDDDDMAEFCWLLGDVRLSEEGAWEDRLRSIKEPSAWRLLGETTPPSEYMGKPVVVHLSGGPQFALPDDLASDDHVGLVAALREADISVGPKSSLSHAVTIDEYLALREAGAEIMEISGKGLDSEYRQSRALPRAFTRGKDAVPRFWVALGVPVSDPAIRHRLATQLTAQPDLSVAGGPTEFGPDSIERSRQTGSMLPPRRAAGGVVTDSVGVGNDGAGGRGEIRSRPKPLRVDGLAVNKRIGPEESSLMYWLGLDVVHGTNVSDVVDDLLHYAAHINAGPGDKPPLTARCEDIT